MDTLYNFSLAWTHYSPAHWPGNPRRNVIHWRLLPGYAVWAKVYLFAAFRK